MAPYTTTQRNAIGEFVNFTKVDKSTAAKLLKNFNWNTQAAVAAYFNDPQSSSSGATELAKVFDRYRDDPQNSPNTIGMDGTQLYCQDLGVSVEDITFLILSEIVRSDTMGEIKREGFLDGWSQVRAISVDRQAAIIKRRAAELPHPAHRDALKRVYRHTFKLFLQPPARSLDIDTAVLLWTILFSAQGLMWVTPSPGNAGGQVHWFELWERFLREKSKRPINKDVWDQTLMFAEKTIEAGSIDFWSEDGAWPGVIDEFVEWIRRERPELDPEKSADAMETE